jgi:hypothetical protein
MAIASDAINQRIAGENDNKKNSHTVQPTPDKKSQSHIHEHPFMKEVCSDYSVNIILFICILLFSLLQVV